jgi:hypothetical protein
VPNLARIVFEGIGPIGESVVNVFYADNEDDFPFAASRVAQGFDSAIGLAILDCLCEDYEHVQTICDIVDGFNNGITGTSLDLAGTPGSIADAPAPIYSCGILQKRTAFFGRASRGRNFYSPIPASWVNVDGLLVGGAANLTALADAMLAGFTGEAPEPWEWALLTTPTGWDVLPKFMTSAAISQYAGIQRRRRGPGD